MTKKYQIRFFFEYGGPCLWGANEFTIDNFGYPIKPEQLPLSQETVSELKKLIVWYQNSLNWSDPSGPLLWGEDECQRFNARAEQIFSALRIELEDDFDLKNEHIELHADHLI
jgi:hypothetical protein